MNDKRTRKTVNTSVPDAKKKSRMDTRERIFNAALKVFSHHSYKDVNIRMIAREAKLGHPLIVYHFGSKAQLFKAVVKKLSASARNFDPTLFAGLNKLSIPDAVMEFIDRLIDYYFDNPESQIIIFLNMAQDGRMEKIPGASYVTRHMKLIQILIEAMIRENNIHFKGSKRDIKTLIYLFHNLMATMIGGRSLHAQFMKMGPKGIEYKDWVKQSLQTLLLPWIEHLT